MASIWTPQLNAGLGGLVIAIGAWLAWDQLSIVGALLVMGAATALLLWRARTIGLIWAWSTLCLGIECFAWPLITMVQIRSSTVQPSDEQMGTILSAVLMGLFSAVFWIAFSYGLFKRARGEQVGASLEPEGSTPTTPRPIASTRPPEKH